MKPTSKKDRLLPPSRRPRKKLKRAYPRKRKLAPSNMAVGEQLFEAGLRFGKQGPDVIDATPKAVALIRDTTIWVVYARAVRPGKVTDKGAQVSHFGMWVLYDDGSIRLHDAVRGAAVVAVAEDTGNFVGILARAGTLNDVQTAEAQAAKHFANEIAAYYARHSHG